MIDGDYLLSHIIVWGLIALSFILMFNFVQDAIDRSNFCNSKFPIDSYILYDKNKLENEYCRLHLDQYGYEDRYFDIPPREYKP